MTREVTGKLGYNIDVKLMDARFVWWAMHLIGSDPNDSEDA